MSQRAGTEELKQALEGILSHSPGAGGPVRIAQLSRSVSPYSSSFSLEELSLALDNGATLDIIFKDLSREAVINAARGVKPSFLYDPLREIEVYRSILPPRMGAPRYYGHVLDEARGVCWLFIERVQGTLLAHAGEFEAWCEAAAWLARMHAYFAEDESIEANPQARHLLSYDSGFLQLWMERANAFVRQREGITREQVQALDRLVSRYGKVVDRVLAMPRTLLHGEFYASNVLVEDNAQGRRIRPVDWEMATIGPGAVDLAALTSGNWSDEQRTALVMAYYEAQTPQDRQRHTPGELLQATMYCQLCLAVQWLGWSPDWSPPAWQQQDWLSIALGLAEELGL